MASITFSIVFLNGVKKIAVLCECCEKNFAKSWDVDSKFSPLLYYGCMWFILMAAHLAKFKELFIIDRHKNAKFGLLSCVWPSCVVPFIDIPRNTEHYSDYRLLVRNIEHYSDYRLLVRLYYRFCLISRFQWCSSFDGARNIDGADRDQFHYFLNLCIISQFFFTARNFFSISIT